jgi:outer membrane protein OmpA-like peptidoglycan-associated protein/tetratricopeptide (TPR) repeat protein
MNKKYFVAIVLTLTFFNTVFAQEQFNLRDKAQKFYTEYKYFQAAALFRKLVDIKSPNLVDMQDLADCCIKMQDFEAAETWYARVVATEGSSPENLIKYGEVLKSNLKYAEAKKILQQYETLTGDKEAVKVSLAGCDSAVVWLANPTIHKLRNEAGVNTPLANFSVFPYKNGVFFTGEPDEKSLKDIYGRTGRPYLRIYEANKATDNTLSDPRINLSIYNKGEYHIGPVSTDKQGKVLYVTRTTTSKVLEVVKAGKTKYSTANLELYLFTQNGDKWEEKAFPYNNVEKYSVGHAALSKDEKTLYFVSNMPGGQGGTDIWYCELQADGSWGTPKNAGTNINTSKNEMFPTIDLNGTLYFSSNGWPGMGGLDLFKAEGAKQNWSKPENLKYPLNSPADDFAFLSILDMKDVATGFLSSTRKGGVGNDDIYSFTYNYIPPKIILALKGNVVNKKDGEPISAASVTLYSDNHQLVARQSSADQGTFLFDLEPGKTYQVLGQKEKFFADSIAISTVGIKTSQTLTAKLQLDPLNEIGKTIAINNIHYNFDKDNIRADAAKILDELVRTMRDNPTLEIELGSHTDSRGVDVYNLDLSQRRAKSVVDYLVSRGIARERMTAKGYGETKLLNKCSNGVKCTEAEHQENRRTEFKIVKY